MKRLIYWMIYGLGVTRLVAWWNRKGVMILCYHGVTGRKSRGRNDPSGLHVREPRFLRQLEHLRRRYRVISLRQYLDARFADRALEPYTVVLTFDDGYRNFLSSAAPLLMKSGLPASLFVITDRIREDGYAETGDQWEDADDERYLSWSDVVRLSKEYGIEIGSHTCTHRKLPNLRFRELEQELKDSQAAIGARVGEGATSLAYPYGEYSSAIGSLARTLGYTCGLTTDAGGNDFRTDLFQLKRILIGDSDDVATFAARLSGVIWLLSGLLRMLRADQGVARKQFCDERPEPS